MEIPSRLKNLALLGGAACTMLGGIISFCSHVNDISGKFLTNIIESIHMWGFHTVKICRCRRQTEIIAKIK